MRNLTYVLERISRACQAYGRDPNEVTVLAVSKTFAADRIRELARNGHRRFGENYLQEALRKMQELKDLDLEWHFIGPIQSNKTKDIAANFSWVHGVDRPKIAQRLDQARGSALPPLNVCVQVNISGESSKSGCAPDQALDLCKAIQALHHLNLRGLMAIPAPAGSERSPVESYRRLKQLFNEIVAQGISMDTLSAGMSADLELAIAHGATMVRVGSALFGSRTQPTTKI